MKTSAGEPLVNPGMLMFLMKVSRTISSYRVSFRDISIQDDATASWADWTEPTDGQVGKFENGSFVLSGTASKTSAAPAGIQIDCHAASQYQ
jgi:hypothetical protein